MYTSTSQPGHRLDALEQIAVGLLVLMAVITFVGTSAQATLWRSSDWLVGTVLPATVVDLTNEERLATAQPPLTQSTLLAAAAQKKAEHMAQNGYFAHFAPDGTTPWDFFSQVGYEYIHAGENLAMHFTDSTQLVDAWMQSPSHRANIVHSQYAHIGVGTARGTFDGHDTVVVVQLFGTPTAATQARMMADDIIAARTQGAALSSIALQPAAILHTVYVLLAALVLAFLATALVREVRQRQYVRVGYSAALLGVLAGLWFLHGTLTGGVTIL